MNVGPLPAASISPIEKEPEDLGCIDEPTPRTIEQPRTIPLTVHFENGQSMTATFCGLKDTPRGKAVYFTRREHGEQRECTLYIEEINSKAPLLDLPRPSPRERRTFRLSK
jgi:hypothetical protein